MLSGLFKRKDKKHRSVDEEPEETEKTSDESNRSSSPSKTSMDSSKEDYRAPKQQPQRIPSKLQKAPPESAKLDHSQINAQQQSVRETESQVVSPTKQQFSGPSVRAVSPEVETDAPQPLQLRSPEVANDRFYASKADEEDKNASRSPSPVSPIEAPQAPPDNSRAGQVDKDIVSDSCDNPHSSQHIESTESYSEKTAHVSPPLESSHVDRSHDTPTSAYSPDETVNPGESSATSSPELIEPHEAKTEDVTPASTVVPSTTPTWNDASLRTYLEDESDIRDLLIIVHDKSNVPPAGSEHPITGSLFKEESKQLNEMHNRLDELLNGWLSRRVAVFSK